MRVLIAGPNYAPEFVSVAPFTTGLAEHLASRGHQVTVATTFPYYPGWKWHSQPRAWRIREHLNGVSVYRAKIVLPRRRTAAWRILHDSSIALTSGLTMLLAPKADVAICVSPPIQTSLVAALLRPKLGKLVILVQDLPTEAARATGIMRDGLILRIGRSMEGSAYRVADHIVVISGAFGRYIKGHGIESARISQIPDWADLESIRPQPADPAVRATLGAAAGEFLVVHSGNMGAKQDLLNVVAAARLLDIEPRIKIAIVGDGAERDKVAAQITREKLLNVKLLPLQPKEHFPTILAAADLLLLNQAPMVVDSVLPSKLLSYMASGRPVLAAVNSESTAAELIRLAGCGEVVKPGEPRVLALAISALASDPIHRAELASMGLRGRAYVEENFDRESILSHWDDLLARLLDEPQTPRLSRRFGS